MATIPTAPVAKTPTQLAQEQTIKDQISKLQGEVKLANDAGYGEGGANAGKEIPDSVLNPSATTPVKQLTGYTPEESAIGGASKDYITSLGYTINPDGTYTRGAAPTTGGVYTDTLAKYQAQIDALDKAKAEAAAKITAQYTAINQRREGGQRALLANAGMLGQESGLSEAQVLQGQDVDELNTNVDASNAKYEAMKSNILSTVQQDADKIYSDKLAAYNGAPDNLIKTLQNQTLLKNGAIGRMVTQAISLGMDLSDPNSLDTVKNAAATLGVTTDSIISAYKTAKKTADDAALKTKQDQDQAAADLEYKQAQTKEANAATSKTYAETRELDIKNAQIQGGGGVYVAGQNPQVDAWVQNIVNGVPGYTAAAVPADLKNAVAAGIAAQGGGNETVNALINDTVDALKAIDPSTAKGYSGAVGAKGLSSFFGLKGKPLAGTDAAGYDANLNRVKNLIALPNLKLLKGVGRITEREFNALSSALTSLDTDMPESTFKTEYDRINQIFTDKAAQIKNGENSDNSQSIPKGTDGASYGFPGYVSDGTQWVKSK